MAKAKEIIKEIEKFKTKLNLIEEYVNLGTLDNTILALMILIAGICLSVVISRFSSFPSSPYHLFITLMVVMFLIPFIYLLVGYLSSIFFKENRFTNKIYTITTLISIFICVVLLAFLPFLIVTLFLFLNINLDIQKQPVFTIILVIVYGVPIALWFYLKKKISIYFGKYYPNVLLKRFKEMDKMDKERREKALKKFGIDSYAELVNRTKAFL